MHREMKIKVGNRYKLVRRDKDLNVIEESEWFNNLMTKHGFDRMLSDDDIVYLACVVGAGNTPPDEDDEYLDSFLYGSRSMLPTADPPFVRPVYEAVNSPRHVKYPFLFRFEPTGSSYNVSEVGVCFLNGTQAPNSTDRVASRALVVDSLGDPTSVSVQSDEYLDVYWDMFIYVPEDSSGQAIVTDDGTPVPTDYVVRGANMSGSGWEAVNVNSSRTLRVFFPSAVRYSPQQSLGEYSSFPAGITTSYVKTPMRLPYTPGSKTRSYTFPLALGEANIGGIGAWLLNIGFGQFQMSFSPKMNKTSAKVATLGVTVTLDNV